MISGVCCCALCCGAVAAERLRPPLSIDISCPHSAQQLTRRTPLLWSSDGTDRRTDGRTPGRFHSMRAVSIKGEVAVTAERHTFISSR